MRSMVTGATGFVGGAVARALLAEGGAVVAAVRDPRRAGTLQDLGADVRQISLADPNQLAAAARGCERIYHCAGRTWHGIERTALPWLHVAGTENLLNAAEHAGVPRVVLLSCADISIHNGDRINWKESHAVTRAAFDPWCQTKLIGEEVALQRGATGSLEVTAIRPAWLWGPGDRSNLPGLCREALRGGIRLWGSGQNLFSTAHVDNVVHAMQLAATAPEAPGQAFHVSDGEYQTSGEFFGAMAQALNMPRPRRGLFALSYGLAAARKLGGAAAPWPIDVLRRARGCLLDNQRAITDLGYEPRVTIAAGMGELARWVEAEGGVAALAKVPPKGIEPEVLAEFEAHAASDP